MKKSTFFKTLLVAAGLLTGNCAWADEIFSLTKNGPFCSGGTFSTVAESGKSMGFYLGTGYNSGWYTSSSESRRLVITLDKALAEGDIIKLTCAINSAGGGIVLYDYTDNENIVTIDNMTVPSHTQNQIITATYTIPEGGALIGQTSIGFGINSTKKDVYMHEVAVERSSYSGTLYKPTTLTEATTININDLVSSTEAGELASAMETTYCMIGKGMVIRSASKTIDGTAYTKGAQSTGDMSNIGSSNLTNGILFMVPAGYGKVTLHFTKDGGYNYLRYSLGMSINEISVASSAATTREFIYKASTEAAIVVSANTKRGSSATFYAIKWEPLTIETTIGATGWTTFTSTYPLDLSNMTASSGDVTAYYASAIDESTVTMTSTTETVEAGTGLMLRGTANATITIPTALSGTVIDSNLLVGCTAETDIEASESLYVLVNNGGTAEFQSLASNGATIPAGKAYLNAAAAGAKLRVVFADDATAIKSIAVDAAENGAIYNLSGQRVNAAYKGIVIKNGKKYLNK